MKEGNGTYLFIPSHSKEVLLSHEEYFGFCNESFTFKNTKINIGCLTLHRKTFILGQRKFLSWSFWVFTRWEVKYIIFVNLNLSTIKWP